MNKIKLVGRGAWDGRAFPTLEFEISEVDYFEVHHENGQNGNKLRAVVNGKQWDILVRENKDRNWIMRQVISNGKLITRGDKMDTYVRTTKSLKLNAKEVKL